MVAAPTPAGLPFLEQQQAMSSLSSSSPPANSIDARQQQQQLGAMQQHYLQQQQQQQLQQQQQQQLQQQQQQHQQQQQWGDMFGRHPTQQFFDPSADSLLASIGQSAYQDMMYSIPPQQQQLPQQQPRRGSDAAATSAFNLLMANGYNNAASAMGISQQSHVPGTQQGSQQQQRLGHSWMNEQHHNSAEQPLSFQRQLQLQQQQLMSGMGGTGYYMQQQQQQFEEEQQRRRRSSMSSTDSLSPIGRRPSQSGNNANALFGSLAGNVDYARFMSAAAAAPTPLVPTLTQQYDNDDEAGAAYMLERQPQPAPRKEKKKRTKTFPEKLMEALVKHDNEDAVAWLPDGKSFVIVSPDLFVNEVLNAVFKQAKYASFVRKLHRWGFVRLTSGTGTDCFHHPHFNRNRREWAGKMVCAPVRGGDGGGGGSRDAVRQHSQQQQQQQHNHYHQQLHRPVAPDKPPSLAGVERFIRAKEAAAALASQAVDMKGNTTTSTSLSTILLGDDDKEEETADDRQHQLLGYADPVKVVGNSHLGPFAPGQRAAGGSVGGPMVNAGERFVTSNDQLSEGDADDEPLGSGSATAEV